MNKLLKNIIVLNNNISIYYYSIKFKLYKLFKVYN